MTDRDDTRTRAFDPPGGADATLDMAGGPGREPDPTVRLPDGQWPEVPGYEIDAELGRGGMGVVYRAHQFGLNRTVALKMVLAGSYARADELIRFLAEAETAAKLQHHGIAQIFGSGRADGLPYFAMEYVDGGTLTDKLAAGPLPAAAAARLGRQLATAVAHAHAAGVVHRDLKPANILLTADDTPKITDFGLARRLEGGDGITRTGAVSGTPSYMPPEQARGDLKAVGPTGDVYSLGAILYECLTGRPPFKGNNPADTLSQVLNTSPPRPRSFSPDVPRDLETVVLKCLEKDPRRRYESAEELAADLDRFLDGHSVTARRVGPVGQTWRWAKRNPAVAGLLAAVFVSLTGGAGVAGWQAVRAEASAAAATEALGKEAEALGAAQHALALVEKEKGRAVEQLARAERYKYSALIALAQRELEDGNVGGAVAALDRCRPDLRGWEHDHLWTACHRRMQTLRGHAAPVIDVAYSPDGRWLASSAADGSVRVWDAVTGRPHWNVPSSGAGNVGVSFARDGRLVVMGPGSRFRVWTVGDEKATFEARCQADAISGPAINPNGNEVAVGTTAGVEVWNLETRTGRRLDPEPKPAEAWNLVYSSDGSKLAVAEDGLVRIAEVATGRVTARFACQNGAVSLAFTPDGMSLLVGHGPVVDVYDPATGLPVRRLITLTNVIQGLAISPDGREVIYSSADARVRLQGVSAGAPSRTFLAGGMGTGVAFHPAGDRVATGADDGSVRVWLLRDNDFGRTYRGHRVEVNYATFDPHGGRVVTGSDDATIRVWEPDGRVLSRVLTGHRNWVMSVRFNRGGDRFVSASYQDPTVLVWDYQTGRPVHALRAAGPAGFYYATFGPNDERVYATTYNGQLFGWNATTGEQLFETTATGQFAFQHVLSPDGGTVLVAHGDGLIRTYDATAGRTLGSHRAYPAGIPLHCLLFTPDGKTLISSSGGLGNNQAEITLWEWPSFRRLRTLRGHSDGIRDLRLTPDGTRLVSVSWDGTTRFWDTTHWDERAILRGHTRGVLGASFRPDGKLLVTASKDATARVWDARMSQPCRLLVDDLPVGCRVRFTPDGGPVVLHIPGGRPRAWDVTTGGEVEPPGDLPVGDRDEADSPNGRWRAWVDGALVLVGRPGPADADVAAALYAVTPVRLAHHLQAAESAAVAGQHFAAGWHAERAFRLNPGATPLAVLAAVWYARIGEIGRTAGCVARAMLGPLALFVLP